ncbi:hypothetical protein GLF_0883 [Gluconobacter frateurii NBRC 101659]|nr:hypothetical protein GLF_0883 [Gluconobacter frateurii NBRC 101659]
MDFTELARKLHSLREDRTGRASGRRMTAMEIWTSALDDSENNIVKILVQITDMGRNNWGLFSRLRRSPSEGDIVHIFVNSNLEYHWQEFTVAKELMHCWSPEASWLSSPEEVKNLATELFGTSMNRRSYVKFPSLSQVGKNDVIAEVAASEIMLPSVTIDRDNSLGYLDTDSIAFRHNLHPDVAKRICNATVRVWCRLGHIS